VFGETVGAGMEVFYLAVKKSYAEINEKIKCGEAVVLTAEEIIPVVEDEGPESAAKHVDVVTTATFGPMCSTGAFLNFGHSDPPIKMSKVWLNDVPAYAGLAAVDVYIGAAEPSETEGINYGGAHVIEDLIAGKDVKLRAQAYGTDCYPRREIETYINKDSLNQAYLFNPRNVYQNYPVAVNSSNRTIYTYMGTLLPHFRNATYCSAGQLNPLLNDPMYRAIGIGTRVFMAGAEGYIAWEGTQHHPTVARNDRGIPTGSAATLALIGDLKSMNRKYIRAASFNRYGTTMFMGIAIPIPVLDAEMVRCLAVKDEDISTTIVDYGVPRRDKPVLGEVTYRELRSGTIELNGKKVPTAPISSRFKAREIASELKQWIKSGRFLLGEPFKPLPQERELKTLEIRGRDGNDD